MLLCCACSVQDLGTHPGRLTVTQCLLPLLTEGSVCAVLGGWQALVVCSPRGLCLCPEDVCKGGCWLLRLFCVFMLCLAQEGECCSSCGAWGEQVLELHPGSWVQLGCLQT